MNFIADLTNCDREPIHIPGQIQSHGFLIAIDQNYIIRFHSENIHTYLSGLPDNLLDIPASSIQPIISENEPPDFIEQLINFGRGNKSFDQTNPFNTDIQGRAFHLIISKAGPFFLLEFEPAESNIKNDLQRVLGSSLTQMLSDKNLQNLLNNSAQQVKQVIGYDRVMIYQFAEDGHGIVVAEAKNDDLPSWMGLHYPASDIPKQARELYKLNLTRIIADVNKQTSKIVITRQFADTPLDLTYSQLRWVSPIHIQYLKNMEVDSSFSISLIYKTELWGLIACHNYTPRFIDYRSRESAKLIGQILSSALEFRQDEAHQHLAEKFKINIDFLSREMLKSNSIEDALTQQRITLLDAVDAIGALLVYENNIIKLGKTPTGDDLAKLLAWIELNVKEPFYYTEELPKLYPDASAFKNVASGMMVLTLSEEMSEYIIWLKPEQIETITWAGNPEKNIEVENGVMKISPRHSFEAGLSRLWTGLLPGRRRILNLPRV
jgi:light-regulated signal transduction histidine kinase (bacteriophytochrome)